MSSRTWFYAEGDKQLGPYSEEQLRNFIGRGAVSAATYVWTEGMSGWQRAGEIPGLIPAAAPRPPGPPVMPQAGYVAASAAGASGGSLSIDFGIWELLGRALIFLIGFLFVIPAPWVAVSFYRWIVSRLRVPGRSNLEFSGQVGDIWWVFVLLALLTYIGPGVGSYLTYILIPVQAFLSWMTIRWLVANISSNGQRLSLQFNGEVWGYIGWYLLLFLSFITIIGWAWVTTAWMRWICHAINGGRRTLIFNTSGWDVLWRTLALAFSTAFIIPIPWMLGWYTRWYVSQFAVVEREG